MAAAGSPVQDISHHLARAGISNNGDKAIPSDSSPKILLVFSRIIIKCIAILL
jgi:hypothetical protein